MGNCEKGFYQKRLFYSQRKAGCGQMSPYDQRNQFVFICYDRGCTAVFDNRSLEF